MLRLLGWFWNADVLNLNFNLVFMLFYGQYVSGSISDEQRKNMLRNSCVCCEAMKNILLH